MTIVMNMSGYEIEREVLAADDEYGDEVMYAEMVPQLVLVNDSHAAEVGKHVDISAELANMDIDAFLKRMYEYQS
jgi:hypothetical protein